MFQQRDVYSCEEACLELNDLRAHRGSTSKYAIRRLSRLFRRRVAVSRMSLLSSAEQQQKDVRAALILIDDFHGVPVRDDEQEVQQLIRFSNNRQQRNPQRSCFSPHPSLTRLMCATTQRLRR